MRSNSKGLSDEGVKPRLGSGRRRGMLTLLCSVSVNLAELRRVFDIKYLADKFSQCSSHLGLALELAGVLGDLNLLTPKARQAISPEIFNQESKYIQLLNQSQESDLQINFQDETSYSRTFSVFEIGLEKDFEMPHIFLKRMFLTGQNIVGSMVDLSNYLLRDVGQPSHFFDLEKLVTLN